MTTEDTEVLRGKSWTCFAARRRLRILRAMSGEQRMLLAYEMSMFARELAREGIRRDHPDWTEAQIARELLRLAFFPRRCRRARNEHSDVLQSPMR